MEPDLSALPIGAAYANRLLAQPGVFDARATHSRIVQGICTAKGRNRKGRLNDPAMATWKLPLPLLWAHDWQCPIGKVTKIEARPSGLWFEARLADGTLEWATRFWEHAKAGRIPASSVQSLGAIHDWELLEISLCEKGAHDEALIRIVKSVRNVVRFDGTPRETIHWDARASM